MISGDLGEMGLDPVRIDYLAMLPSDIQCHNCACGGRKVFLVEFRECSFHIHQWLSRVAGGALSCGVFDD